MVKIIPYYRVFRTLKKKVNFFFYLIGPTEWAMSISSTEIWLYLPVVSARHTGPR